MWIEPAYAQQAAQPGGIFELLTPIILIFGIMYFLLIRPQQKRQKQHQEKISSVKRGDKVVTGGGIFGTVRRVGDEGRLSIEIAKDVQIEVMAHTLSDVLLKSEPQAGTGGGKSSGGLFGKLFGGKNAETPPKADTEPESKNTDDKKARTQKASAKKSPAKKKPTAKKNKEATTESNTTDA